MCCNNVYNIYTFKNVIFTAAIAKLKLWLSTITIINFSDFLFKTPTAYSPAILKLLMTGRIYVISVNLWVDSHKPQLNIYIYNQQCRKRNLYIPEFHLIASWRLHHKAHKLA